MKILAISINDPEGNQTVFYENDEGKQRSRVTPIIGEDGLILNWMKANPVNEPVPEDEGAMLEDEPVAVPVVKKASKYFRGPKR
jgi:hypothetical protein